MNIITLSEDAVSIGVPRAEIAHQLAAHLRTMIAAEEIVPTATSVVVRFDPTTLNAAAIEEVLQQTQTQSALPPPPPARAHRIAVEYGGDAGPELADVASAVGMTPSMLIKAHAFAPYTVSHVGFLPGFAYLSGLPEAMHLPRRPSPCPRLAPGSIAIAGRYCGIYPLPSPGGWHVIGRTDHPLFAPHKEDPFTLRPGDQISFVPI